MDVVAWACALLTIFIGATVLLSWQLSWTLLSDKSVFMNPLSSICFVLSGVALYLNASAVRSSGKKWAARVLPPIVFAFSIISLARIWGWDLPLDRLFFANELGANRMAPNTALAFLTIAMALIMGNWATKKGYRPSEAFSLATFLLSLLALIGYLYGASTLYGLPNYIPMAIHSGITFMILSVGTLVALPDGKIVSVLTSRDLGGQMARKILPAVIFVPIVLGWLRLHGFQSASEDAGVAFMVLLTIVALGSVTWFCARSLSLNDQEFRKQGQILRSVLDSIGDGVAVADANGKHILFNPAAKRLLGLGLAPIGPSQWSKHYGVFLPDQVTPVPEPQFPLNRAVRGEETNEVEEFIRNPMRPDGLFISVTGRPLRDQDDRVQGGVAVFRDITEKKRAEQQLRDNNAELERQVAEHIQRYRQSEAQVQQLQKMDAIGRLAGGVAHDFNNILGAIRLYCDLIDDEAAKPEVIRENTAEIRQTAERGAGLTRQLLTFSRKQVVQLMNMDINELIPDLLKMLKRLIGENYEIVTRLHPGLHHCKVDPSQIEQVLLNLVVNARDAMPSGGRITLSTENINLGEEFTSTHLMVKPGPHVQIAVSDEGLGMDAAIQAQIFEPFFTTKPIGKGTGLGLSTVYGIVKQCKGTIWVYSEMNKGSVFKIYLPATEGTIKIAEPQFTPISSGIGGETILLVEDEEKMRKLIANVLAKRGYTVLTAENGHAALQLLRTHPTEIHLLLTDVVMPQMGGFELARQVQSLRSEIRVIYMSGYANDTFQNQPEVDIAFIQKPFDSELLMTKVREVLG